jgi:hypothetical protein
LQRFGPVVAPSGVAERRDEHDRNEYDSENRQELLALEPARSLPGAQRRRCRTKNPNKRATQNVPRGIAKVRTCAPTRE